MTLSKLNISLLAALGLAASQAQALTVNYSGSTATSGTAGNTISNTTGGVTVTASAWYSATGGDPWLTAYLGNYSGGLGVTDPTESGSGDSHTVDNVSKYNRVVFDFTSSVILDKVGLSIYGDSDISIFYYNGSAWTFLEDNTSGTSSSSRTADINAAALAASKWAVAADTTTDLDDEIKISSITFSAVPPPPSVPDSGSTLLFLATGMALLFLAKRQPSVA